MSNRLVTMLYTALATLSGTRRTEILDPTKHREYGVYLPRKNEAPDADELDINHRPRIFRRIEYK